MASETNLAIQPVEYTNHLHARAGASGPLEAQKHVRSSRSKWRFPLCALLCAALPFMILAWGTAYKQSLYRHAKTGVPAKVCTRGSDSAETANDHAISGRKLIGSGFALLLQENFRIALPRLHESVFTKATRVTCRLHSGVNLGARPPPPISPRLHRL